MAFEIINNSEDLSCTKSNHIPNEETRKVIEETRQSKGLISDKEAAEITKKFSL